MIEEHLDPTVEAHAHITNLLRTLVTAAAGIAEKRAQRRAQELQEAQRRSEEHRRALTERLAVQRQAAELVYRAAYRDSWWQKATPEQVAAAVEAAGTWAASDPRANDALSHLAERLHDRYDIDLVDLHRNATNPARVPGAIYGQVIGSQRARIETATGPRDAKAAVLAAAGPTLGPQIVASEGWHHLQQRLDPCMPPGTRSPNDSAEPSTNENSTPPKTKASPYLAATNLRGSRHHQQEPGPRLPPSHRGWPPCRAAPRRRQMALGPHAVLPTTSGVPITSATTGLKPPPAVDRDTYCGYVSIVTSAVGLPLRTPTRSAVGT
jgi:hypothetical protein